MCFGFASSNLAIPTILIGVDMYKGMIPFDKDTGSLVSDPYKDEEHVKYDWISNHIFHMTLEFIWWHCWLILPRNPGEPTVVNDWQDFGTLTKYRVFDSDLIEILRSNIINHGIVECNWTFAKKGYKYGIRMATEKDREDFEKWVSEIRSTIEE
jgi:hypothetical protein